MKKQKQVTTSQATDKNSSSKNSNWEKLVAVENRDANGNLVSTIPYPQTGNTYIRQKAILPLGPDGIVVKDYRFRCSIILLTKTHSISIVKAGNRLEIFRV